MEFTPEGPLALPLWINGRALMTLADAFLDVPDPAGGPARRRVPLCGAGEAAEAVSAARGAQPLWAEMGLQARRVCLGRLADALENYAGHFAKLLGEESAADEATRLAEVAAAVDALRALAVGETGVCGVVLGAETPLAGLARAIAPALMAGAAVVVKPSPRAPSAVFALCELTARVEWPAGVLNLLQGDAAALEGLCAAGIDRLIYEGEAGLGERVAAVAAAAGVPFVARDRVC